MRPAVLLLALFASAAAAVPVTQGVFGASFALPGTTAAAEPSLAGVVQLDQVVPWTNTLSKGGGPSAHGTIQLRVVKTGAGTLDFYWKVNVAADTKNPIIEVFVNGFPNGSYDANWRQDGLGTVAPDHLLTDSLRLRFQFIATPIAAGKSSRFFYVRTKATSFNPTAAGFTVLSAQSTGTQMPAPRPK